MNEEIKQKFCREFGSDRVLLEEPMKEYWKSAGQKISRILFLEMEAIFLSVTEDTGGL